MDYPERHLLRKTANSALRERAEARFASMHQSRLSGDTVSRLQQLQELMIRQIEFELQQEELRAAYAQLDLDNERLQLAADLAGEGLWEWDLASGEVYFSPRYLAIAGNPPATAATLEFFLGLVHPDDRDMVWHAMEMHLSGASDPCRVDYRLIRSDGEVRWVAGTGRVVARAADGSAQRMIGIIIDVTEHRRRAAAFDREVGLRQRLEEELQRADAFGNLILETIPEAILVIDPEGRIIRMNSHAIEVFGYAPAELVGQPVEILIPDTLRHAHLQLRHGFSAEAMPRMMGSNRDLRALRKDGSEFPVEVGLGPLHGEDGQYVIASVADITRRKQAEREVNHLNQVLSELLAEKSNALHATREALQDRTAELGVALRKLAHAERGKVEEERKRVSLELHDVIGQLLAALSLNLEMIRRKSRDDGIMVPLNNAVRITEDIIDGVHRIVHSMRPPQLDELGLAAALRWHIDSIRKNSYLDISLTENLGKGRLPREIELDCFRIVQESLSNVMRHASASQVRVQLLREGDQLRLTVSDNGVGFDPGSVLVDDAQRGHVGLQGMRERVHGCGGRLCITAEPGQGCTIEAEFPLADVEGRET